MKLIVFLADGFEEIEALTVVDFLKRLDIQVDMVSIEDGKSVKGAHGIRVEADYLIEEVDSKEYKGLTIPGGMPGATSLRDNQRVIEIVKEMYEDEKLISAICAGPIVLAEAGIIDGRDITSFPGFEEELSAGNYREDKVVRDGNIITARGPAMATDFTLEISEYLLGEDKKKELEESILYNLL